MQRGLIAEIDLSAVIHNLLVAKGLAKGSHIIAVVKAGAYGHGAVEVSRVIEHSGIVSAFAVAFTSEAVELRSAGIKTDIISLFDPDPQDVLAHNIIPVISSIKQARALSDAAFSKNRIIRAHLKVDTGMGRTGFDYEQPAQIKEACCFSNLIIEGVMSHFSEADIAHKDFAFSQIDNLKTVKDRLEQEGISVGQWHIANSAALISIPDALFNAVRPGIMLYGYSPLSEAEELVHRPNLLPVMTIKTSILQIRKVKAGRPISYGRTFTTKRDSLIAVLPVGYADGINRLFSNNLEVLVYSRRVPVAGRVCMDTTMIDITDIKDAVEGSEVVIMGAQGSGAITANELADRIGTIPYEMLTSFGGSARRTYVNSRLQ